MVSFKVWLVVLTVRIVIKAQPWRLGATLANLGQMLSSVAYWWC